MTAPTRSAADQMAAEFDAIAERDLERLSEFWHDQTTEVFHALDVVLVGRDVIRPFFAELFTAVPDLDFRTEAIHGVDDRIAVGQWRILGTFAGGPFQGIEPTGRPVDLHGIDVMRFAGDGRLDHNDVYYDGLTFARQIGMLPTADSRGERGMRAVFNAVTRVRRSLRRRIDG